LWTDAGVTSGEEVVACAGEARAQLARDLGIAITSAIAFTAASVLSAAAAIASVHVVLRREEAASTA
jgi:hypothetical protein